MCGHAAGPARQTSEPPMVRMTSLSRAIDSLDVSEPL